MKHPICILKYKYFVLLQCVTIWYGLIQQSTRSTMEQPNSHMGANALRYKSFQSYFLCLVFTSSLTFANNRWSPVRQFLCIIRCQAFLSAVICHNSDAMFSCPILQGRVSTLLTTRLHPLLCIYYILYIIHTDDSSSYHTYLDITICHNVCIL